MKASLLILAAGMGSRYGGLKQMDAFGPNGETILDYSIYDAINAGFTKIVFIIRESFKEDFKAFFAGKFEDQVEIAYVTQELTKVPAGISYNPERAKPWGTAHAVQVAKDVINEPFAVINADDYYGKESFEQLISFFKSNEAQGKEKYSLVGYKLENTLSRHGTVNRGVCEVGTSNDLVGINERLKIGYNESDRIAYPDDEAGYAYLYPDTLVSMNMWGFYPSYFDYCEDMFTQFLKDKGGELKSEFFIPLLIDSLISSGREQVEVLSCDAEWFGVTYQEDKPFVVDRLNTLIAKGIYPSQLWK